jgi:hypothetical protein
VKVDRLLQRWKRENTHTHIHIQNTCNYKTNGKFCIRIRRVCIMRAFPHASIQIINNLTVCIADLVKQKKSCLLTLKRFIFVEILFYLRNVNLLTQLFTVETYLLYIRTQCIPRSKHSPLR